VIPYFDFFNHADFKEEKWSWGYKAEHKFFHVSAIRSVKKGHQIYQFYGPYPNSKLLLDYGFILDSNSFDSVEVEPVYFGVNPEDELFSLKERIVSEIREKPEKLLVMKNSLSQELLEAAHAINGEKEDFTEDGKLVKKIGPIVDFFMGQYFQAVLNHKLQQYPTTLQEDEDLMKTTIYTGMSNRAQMAIAVRAEEKRILHSLVDIYAKKEQKIRHSFKNKDDHDEL